MVTTNAVTPMAIWVIPNQATVRRADPRALPKTLTSTP